METGVSILNNAKMEPYMNINLEDVRIRDILVFLETLRLGSVRDVARQRNCHPGQISKILNNLEAKIGFKLLERSPFGVTASERALALIPLFDEIGRSENSIRECFQKSKDRAIISIASTSFFSTHILPEVLANLDTVYPNYRIRLLDLAPDSFMPVAMRNGFQICLHLKDLDWPKTWTSQSVGVIRWKLCCRDQHPALKRLSLDEVMKFPFIFPVYWTSEGIAYGSDHFPLESKKRIRGIETTTAVSAVEIIRLTDQIGFVPEIVARPYLESGALKVIDLPELKEVKQKVYLSVKSDQISKKMFDFLSLKFQQLLY